MGQMKAAGLGLLLGMIFIVQTIHAETRWCAMKLDEMRSIVYPPVARASHVSGAVISRVIFSTDGKVVQVLPISGHGSTTNVALSYRVQGH